VTVRVRPLEVEVVARQGSHVLDVVAVGGRLRAYRIGEGRGAQVTVAVAGAAADGCWTLVWFEGEAARLQAPPQATGEWSAAGAEARPLVAGTSIELADGTCATVHVGPLTFEVRAAPAVPRVALRPEIEWPLWLAQAASLALLVGLALLLRLFGPSEEPPRWGDPELMDRLIRYVAEAPQVTPSEPPAGGEARTPAPASPRVTARPPAPEAAPTERTFETGLRGHDVKDMSRQAGFLGLAEFDRILRGYTASLEESIRNYAPSAAQDAAWSAAAKAVPRAIAGLGLGETLRGGGGLASEVVDLDLGELLAGLQARRKRGPAGTGRKEAAFAEPKRVTTPPAPRQNVEWTASVGKELIRGVVRRYTPEVRKCFREGPATGKVEVAFTIGEGGKVTAAAIEASTVDNASVEACITATVMRWTFPTVVAGAGDVAVRYPFSVG
jgi:hypothetical protein